MAVHLCQGPGAGAWQLRGHGGQHQLVLDINIGEYACPATRARRARRGSGHYARNMAFFAATEISEPNWRVSRRERHAGDERAAFSRGLDVGQSSRTC
jgi:hypothetical protein